MKLTVKPNLLKNMILGAGIFGFALRVALYTTGFDGQNLLIHSHWASVSLWILTAVVTVAIIIFTQKLDGPADYNDALPASFSGAVGAFAAAFGIGITTVREFAEFYSRLHLIVWILGLCATVALVLVGISRLLRNRPAFPLHTIVCIYFALRMVSQYQRWSADPQLMDYCFYLTACVALMLTGYHQAAFAAELGKHRSLWRLSLTAVYLCCLSLVGSRDTLLMLTCGIWAFTNLTSLTPRPRRQRPALILEVETTEQQP